MFCNGNICAILESINLQRKKKKFYQQAVDRDGSGEISIEEFKMFYACLGLSEEVSFCRLIKLLNIQRKITLLAHQCLLKHSIYKCRHQIDHEYRGAPLFVATIGHKIAMDNNLMKYETFH